MDRWQLIDAAGVKYNIIKWDGEAELDLPPGCRAEPEDDKPMGGDFGEPTETDE